MRFNADNNKNRAMNGSRCRDTILPAPHRASSMNSHGAPQACPSGMAGAEKREHPSGLADKWSLVQQRLVPGGNT